MIMARMQISLIQTIFLLCTLFGQGAATVAFPNTIQRVPHSGRQCREIDFDAVSLIEEGTIWQRRCHTCACIDGEIECWGPHCQHEYDPTFEYICTQWSEDECCCEHVGCLIEGEHVDLNAWYPSPDYPCVSCQCSMGGPRLCNFSESCHAGAVSLDDQSVILK